MPEGDFSFQTSSIIISCWCTLRRTGSRLLGAQQQLACPDTGTQKSFNICPRHLYALLVNFVPFVRLTYQFSHWLWMQHKKIFFEPNNNLHPEKIFWYFMLGNGVVALAAHWKIWDVLLCLHQENLMWLNSGAATTIFALVDYGNFLEPSAVAARIAAMGKVAAQSHWQ